MRHACKGDADAFAAIYDRHSPVLLALGRRMLRSATEAQDLLQDVFMEAWERVSEYDAGKASVRTWLLVRLRSRALDRMALAVNRRRASEPERTRAEALATAKGEDHEQRLAVQQALAELDEDVRGTLELSYFEGMTSTEIAERMGTPLGTVKSRLARGLARLQRVLDEHGGEGDG
jgi:RNA polymerase sigma-70 factor (ECF subfamily)